MCICKLWREAEFFRFIFVLALAPHPVYRYAAFGPRDFNRNVNRVSFATAHVFLDPEKKPDNGVNDSPKRPESDKFEEDLNR